MKNSIRAFIVILIITALACSFSMNADLGTNSDSNQNSSAVNNSSQNDTVNTQPDALGSDLSKTTATPTPANQGVSQGGGLFPDADEVISVPADENTFTSPAGQIYVEVQIKSGPDILTFTEDQNDGCILIMGLGTSTVNINRVGDGRNCKEFGGIGLFYGE